MTQDTFKMVVGVELDETGQNALTHAMNLQRRTNGEIHICYASKSNTDDPEKIVEQLDKTLEALKQWLAGLDVDADVAAHTTIHPGLGNPARVLEQLAVDLEANLIIVGTHGRKGVKRLVQGSVAHDLLNAAPCPVAVAVPRQFEGLEKSPMVEPAHPEGMAHSHIAHPHAYHYRRSIRFSNVVGAINPSGIPSRGF